MTETPLSSELARGRGEAVTAADRLLEESWGAETDGRLRGRALATELGLLVSFLIASVALLVLVPVADMPLDLTLGLGFAYAIASRVEFPVGAGQAVPTQLFLVPMVLLLPPQAVPLVVLCSLTLASAVGFLRGRNPISRTIETGADSWHTLGPVIVLVLAGSPGPQEAPWWLYIAAFGAQIVSELMSATLREWLSQGIPPQLQLRVLGIVWTIDALLTPVGVVAAFAAADVRSAPIALLGVAAVLAVVSRDRNQRIDQAHDRLEALRRERHRLRIAIHRIGDAFASKLDIDALLSITARASVEALDASGGRASACLGHERRLVRRATVHETEALASALRTAEETALARGEAAVAVTENVWAIASPVMAQGAVRPSGVIAVARTTGAFLAEERDLLVHLCEQAGVAAANIERHEDLHRQALTDELTGLANHRRFQELLADGVDRFDRSGVPLALLLLDLDDFKAINDSRGHQTGDRVLRTVSDTLRECCRGDDEPARYGGEELALVMQGGDLNRAVRLAERVRAAIEAIELVDMDGAMLRVTASVGVATLSPQTPDGEALIASADQALYQAKRDGKNCVRYGSAQPAADLPSMRLAQ